MTTELEVLVDSKESGLEARRGKPRPPISPSQLSKYSQMEVLELEDWIVENTSIRYDELNPVDLTDDEISVAMDHHENLLVLAYVKGMTHDQLDQFKSFRANSDQSHRLYMAYNCDWLTTHGFLIHANTNTNEGFREAYRSFRGNGDRLAKECRASWTLIHPDLIERTDSLPVYRPRYLLSKAA